MKYVLKISFHDLLFFTQGKKEKKKTRFDQSLVNNNDNITTNKALQE